MAKKITDRRKRYFALLSVISLLVLFSMGAATLASWTLFRRSVEASSEKTLRTAADFALLEIDGDKIDKWLTNGADDDYRVTLEKLQQIADHTPNLAGFTVYRRVDDGYVVVFDVVAEWKSPDSYTYELNDPFEAPMTDQYCSRLDNGETILEERVVFSYGDETDTLLPMLTPVFDSKGNVTAYLSSDISVQGLNDYGRSYAMGLMVVAVVLLVIFIIVGFFIFMHASRIEDKVEDTRSKRILRELIEAFARAVDLKDPYTQGHSSRVAEYSVKIAKELGKSDEECEKIRYAGLLHDIGKILVPDSIINKPGRLNTDEFNKMKLHTVNGYKILSSIEDFPYISLGAHYHHERYDGGGYPDHLKGEDIPEIARIIAVADAYDAMSSNRSYRDAIPQDLVREEIVKGSGLQFDPTFAKVMQHLIDNDTEYQMKERAAINAFGGENELRCYEYRSKVSEGIVLSSKKTHIHLEADYLRKDADDNKVPALVLFDSLDGHVQTDKDAIRALCYFEYCEISLDGKTRNKNVRQIKVSTKDHEYRRPGTTAELVYDIEAVKYKDHVLIRIDDGNSFVEATVALPDSTRFAYIGITGEYCHIHDITIDHEDTEISADYIPRICDPITYIDGPEGDIPNLQIDSYRTEASDGIPVEGKFEISFHTKSLPTARLIWHCPYFVIFTSDDGKVNGTHYKELSLIRLDGENWESEGLADNNLVVNKHDSFEGWSRWKEINKEGYDSSITFERTDSSIIATTYNHGIYIRNTTNKIAKDKKVYVALSGDEVALTDIRIKPVS